MTKAEASRDSKGWTARPAARRRRRGCRDCPFRAPSGQCLDTRMRSGRCGDRVWYPLPGGKQGHRLWVKPRDPKTPKQRYWRARLGAASRNYSAALTDEQQDACIAAGAKRRSRPRLGEWGWLTGQQFWVGQQCATKAEAGVQNGEKCIKALQTKGISAPAWDPHRSASLLRPWHHRRNMGRAKKDEGRRKDLLVGTLRRNVRVWVGADASARRLHPSPMQPRTNEGCRRQKEQSCAEATQLRRITPSSWQRSRLAAWGTLWQLDRKLRTVDYYSWAATRERGPPKAYRVLRKSRQILLIAHSPRQALLCRIILRARSAGRFSLHFKHLRFL